MALKNPVSSHRVIAHGEYTRRVTLPRRRLEACGIGANDVLAASWQRDDETLEIYPEPFDDVDELREEHGEGAFALEVVTHGNALVVTIPSAIRYSHSLGANDELILRHGRAPWRLELDAGNSRTRQSRN